MEQLLEVAERPSFTIQGISEHLERLGYPLRALHVYENCGKPIHQFIMASCGCGTRVIQLSHRCDKTFCSECSKIRQKRLRKRFLPYLQHYQNGALYKWHFLTLKPQNYGDYKEGKAHLKKSFKKFLRRDYIKERIKGGFWVVEVTNHGKGWHFHIHAIIYSRRLDNSYRGFCPHCRQNYLKYDHTSEKFYCANRRCNQVYEGEIEDSKLCREFLSSMKSKSFPSPQCQTDITPAYSQGRVLNYMLKYISEQKDSFDKIEDFTYHLANSYHDRQINSFGDFYDFKKQIGLNRLMQQKQHYCPICNEVIKFSYDPEVSFILAHSSSAPPDPQQELEL